MTLKMIAVDLDGTLLKDDKTFDEQWLRNIKGKLDELGISFCVATGNSYHKVYDYFTPEDRRDEYFIADNGSVLVYNEEYLYKNGLSRQDYMPILRALNEQEVYSFVSTGEMTYVRSGDEMEVDIAQRYNGCVTIVDSYDDIPKDKIVTKIASYLTDGVDMSSSLLRNLQEKFPYATILTSGLFFMDIIPADSGKGEGIKILKEKQGLRTDQIMAIGDNMNDKSMMDQAGYRVAMKNANPDLIPYCNYQIGTNEDQAVLQFLQDIADKPDLSFIDKYRI